MSGDAPDTIELTPDSAASFLREELALAGISYATGDVDAALNAYVRALGLALQLGPAASEYAVAELLAGTRDMDPDTLAALGPALVRLDEQVREAGVVADNPVMQSWAAIVAYTGMLIGLLGVAGALPAGDRQGLAHKVRASAIQLDGNTENLFDFTAWVDDIVSGWA